MLNSGTREQATSINVQALRYFHHRQRTRRKVASQECCTKRAEYKLNQTDELQLSEIDVAEGRPTTTTVYGPIT